MIPKIMTDTSLCFKYLMLKIKQYENTMHACKTTKYKIPTAE